MPKLTEEQIERYSRQLLLPGWGSREQRSLAGSHIAVSARAEAAALYLAGAGVGRMSLLFADDDALATRLRALNPDVAVVHWRSDLPVSDTTLLLAGEDAPAELAGGAVKRSEATLSAQALAAAILIKECTNCRPAA